jgi:hypothetical protein
MRVDYKGLADDLVLALVASIVFDLLIIAVVIEAEEEAAAVVIDSEFVEVP